MDRKIETYSEKPKKWGNAYRYRGDIYLTALETNSVAVVLAKDKSVKTMIKNPNMLWSHGVSYNHVDDYMYVSAAQVSRGAVYNEGKGLSTKPFYIFRF
ncbi:hypothetical protein JBL43_13135 [Aureibaculum sp. A20]|uniref:Uncharacterized protein n=1 Tax=Aureibaculum flavum TaxID=2795986 RepID=A0ABS0WT86_9FLAO|nr:hypothetical protein [Aureibaculum flavum]MBJ2175190.1 hypothetical protein [Aureibaculum flavum]